MVALVDFNILWLIQSGPMALFTKSNNVWYFLFLNDNVTLVSSIVEIDETYVIKTSILAVSEYYHRTIITVFIFPKFPFLFLSFWQKLFIYLLNFFNSCDSQTVGLICVNLLIC